MRFIFTLSLLVIFNYAFSQDKLVEIKPTNKTEFLGFEYSENGLFYIATGKGKNPKAQIKILNYDQNLDLIYEKQNNKSKYEPLPAFFGRGMNDLPSYYDMYATTNGKYLISNIDRFIINREGEQSQFNFDEDDETEDIKTFFSFYSDNYACYLGKIKKRSRKNKNVQQDDNIYFFKRSLSDQSTKKVALQLPPIQTDAEQIGLGLHSFDEDGFYLLNKVLDKESAIDIYNLIKYSYEGELLSSISIEVTLGNKFFTTSNCGFGSSTKVYSPNFSHHKLGENATGNIYIDNDNKEYYVFGLYSNKKDLDLYNARNNGFYIKKYSFDGNLIWDSFNSIKDKDYNKNSVSYFTSVEFFNLKNEQKGIRISNKNHDYSFMFLLNNSDGKVTKNKKVEFKVSNIKLQGIRGGSFPTGYSSKKDYGKNNLNVNTFFASFISPSVSEYFESVKSKKNNYNSFILDTGIYILEEDLESELFRLMKFEY
ncbi:hypothetical protein [Winogradskyella rapida]|uniref:Uncharacterized protein n=1 Tax=Winogradskyella rapida TaxID=549701 RepID=A0ABW3KQL8_9FLAO